MGSSPFGKKIFILYPHSVIQDELLDTLIMNGYEAYVLGEHKRARRLLAKFSDSIMFINIDEGMAEPEWEEYIREIQKDEKTKECRLGILSYNTDRDLMEKYLMDIAVPCGYIQLKLGVQASTKIILDALKANEARGCRKYIRVDCSEETNITVNFKNKDKIYYGKLLDISAAGFAARIDGANFVANSVLRDVQLRLRGTLIMLDAVLMGRREDDQSVLILLFAPNMSAIDKQTIQHFIKQTLQRYIDQLKV